jgi:hypothetical protein
LNVEVADGQEALRPIAEDALLQCEVGRWGRFETGRWGRKFARDMRFPAAGAAPHLVLVEDSEGVRHEFRRIDQRVALR